MSVSVFGSPFRHRVARIDADPRLVWTVCGIRTQPDRHGYQRALEVTGGTAPTQRCSSCDHP